jgi:predicted type IV restriction endonuclease
MGGKRFDEKVETKLKDLFNSFSLQGAVDKLRDSESSNSKLGIVTTQEELTAFSVIRTILATSGKFKADQIDRISYRDFKGHFSIIVDDSQTKSICTLVLSGKKTLRIGNTPRELEDPIEVSLAKYKKDIIESAISNLS